MKNIESSNRWKYWFITKSDKLKKNVFTDINKTYARWWGFNLHTFHDLQINIVFQLSSFHSGSVQLIQIISNIKQTSRKQSGMIKIKKIRLHFKRCMYGIKGYNCDCTIQSQLYMRNQAFSYFLKIIMYKIKGRFETSSYRWRYCWGSS